MTSLSVALEHFVDDPTNKAIFILVALDFLLGVFAAVKTKTFRLSYIADFLRNDVVGKVLPYFGVWWALHVGGDVELGSLELVEEVTGAAIVAALLGSVLNSLRDARVPGIVSAPDELAGPDPGTPV